MRNLGRLKRLGNVNHFMQNFFRRWHQATEAQPATGSVNISEMKIIREMNQRLKDDLSSGRFFDQFELNLQQLETLACEIVQQSGLPLDTPFDRSSHAAIHQGAFDQIFAATLSGPLDSTADEADAVAEFVQQ